MASFSKQCLIFFLAFLAMIQLCLGDDSNSNPANQKVKLDLYYESLCPGCSAFIINDISLIFENGLIDIVDLHLVPWGNSKLNADEMTFTCQHGPDECLLDTVEACAIDAWPNVKDHFALIKCIEDKSYEGEHNKWNECFNELKMDPTRVTACYKGKDGIQLEKKYKSETDKLKPPHEFVPWVVINGKPLEEDFDHFVSAICKAYKGPPPSACKIKTLASVWEHKTNLAHPHPIVCYNKET